MPRKNKLEDLRNDVQSKEERLEEAMASMKKTTTWNRSDPNKITFNEQRWEALEKVVAVMTELLSTYRKYAAELERYADVPKAEAR